MADLGNVIVKVETDASKLTSGLSEATKSVQSFADKSKVHIVATVGEIGRAVKEIVTYLPDKISESAKALGNLYDNIEKLGVGVKLFQELSFAAGKAGLSTDGLQQSMFLLQKNVGSGSEDVKNALDSIGLSINAIRGLSPDEMFLKVSEALGKVQDRTKQTDLGFTLLGRSYKESAGLINSDIRGTIAEFDKLGLALTKSQLAAADTFDETKEAFGMIFEGFTNKVTAEVSPAFTALIQQVTDFITASGGIDAVAKSFSETLVSGVNSAVEAMKRLLLTFTDIQIILKEAEQRRNTLSGNENQTFTAQQVKQITEKPYDGSAPYSERALQNSYIPNLNEGSTSKEIEDLYNRRNALVNFNGNGGIGGAGNVAKDLQKSVPAIQAFTTKIREASAIIGDMKDVVKSAVSGAKQVMKADDAFSQAFKAQDGSQDQIDRIVKGSMAGKPVANDKFFDDVASRLLDDIRSGGNPNSADNKEKLQTLGRWSTAKDGLDHSAQRNAVDEIYKYINNTTGQKVDVQLTVTPTPYAMIEWSNSPEGKKVIQGVQDQSLADSAAASSTR